MFNTNADGTLRLCVGDNWQSRGGMVYQASLQSHYAGRGFYTQIFYDFSTPAQFNEGCDVLDDTEIYLGADGGGWQPIQALGSSFENGVQFQDYPSNPCDPNTSNTTELNVWFYDYLRFQPCLANSYTLEPNSIPVTVGIITWKVDAAATCSGARWCWELLYGNIAQATYSSSDSFPIWTSTKPASR